MSVSAGMSFNNAVTVPAGKFPKKLSVGANTVNGPGPESVPSKLHASIWLLMYYDLLNLKLYHRLN